MAYADLMKGLKAGLELNPKASDEQVGETIGSNVSVLSGIRLKATDQGRPTGKPQAQLYDFWDRLDKFIASGEPQP